jgi:hypothetical protein
LSKSRVDENSKNRDNKRIKSTEQFSLRYLKPGSLTGGINDATDNSGDYQKHAENNEGDYDIRKPRQKRVEQFEHRIPNRI